MSDKRMTREEHDALMRHEPSGQRQMYSHSETQGACVRETQGFLGRLLDALDEDYPELSYQLGIPIKELQKLEALNRGDVIELNRDIIWTLLSDHVDERIGKLISIREELSRKLAGDRKRQIVQRARIKGRW